MIKSRWFNNEMIQAFPLAHLMRETFPEHWIRIHSLPESKRYPETEAEKGIIFDRYSLFGTALLGHGASCLIIQSRFLGFPRLDEFMPEFSWQQIHQVGKDEDDTWNSWQAPITWTPKEMRPLLLAIAEDKEAHIAFLSNITDCVFIPTTVEQMVFRSIRNYFKDCWKSFLLGVRITHADYKNSPTQQFPHIHRFHSR